MSYQRRGMGLDYGADRLRSVDTGKSAGLKSDGMMMKDVIYLPPKQPAPPMDAIREVGTPATGMPIAMVAADKAPSPIDKAVEFIKEMVAIKPPPTVDRKPPPPPTDRKPPPGNGVDLKQPLDKSFVPYDGGADPFVKQPPIDQPPPDLTTTKCAPGMEANQIPATATPIIGLAKAAGCSNVAGELWCCLPGTNLAMAAKPPEDKAPPLVDRGFCPPNHVPDGYGGCVELSPFVVGPNGLQNGEALPPAMPVCAEGQAYDTVRQVCVSQAQAAAAGPRGLGAVPWWVWLAGAGVIGYVVWKRSEGGKAKTKTKNPRGDIYIHPDIAEKMLNWHSSGGDPIYAAGSYGMGNHPVKRAVAQRAVDNFDRIHRKAVLDPSSGGWSQADVDELADILDYFAEEHGIRP